MLDLINHITRCVDCKKETMFFHKNTFRCNNCHRTYIFDKDGILDAFPKNIQDTRIRSQKSEFFSKWLRAFKEEIEHWVIYKSSFFRFFSQSGHNEISNLLSTDTSDSLCVDFGCGPGFSQSILKHPKYVGVDFNKDTLIQFKKNHPLSICIHSDMNNSPFGNNSIDTVISLHTLEHIYDIELAMVEINRILTKNGKFLFCIPTEGSLVWEIGRKLITKPNLRKRYGLDGSDVMEIEHLNDAKRVLKFIKWHFSIKSVKFLPFPIIPSISFNACIVGDVRKADSNHPYKPL